MKRIAKAYKETLASYLSGSITQEMWHDYCAMVLYKLMLNNIELRVPGYNETFVEYKRELITEETWGYYSAITLHNLITSKKKKG
jgi:hypothetical protein